MTQSLEQVTGPIVYHGEGPFDDPATGRLHWVDMFAGDLLTRDSEGAISRRHIASVLTAGRRRRGGGLVLAVERGFALLDAAGAVRELPPLWSDTEVRFNDGACDALGGFWCGSMAYDAAPGRGTLWRLDPDGSTRVELEGVTISNGLAFLSDGRRALYVDTPTSRVDLLELDDSCRVVDRRPWAHIDDPGGVPDGIALDAAGGLWVAIYDGGALHHYDATGRLDEVVQLPVSKPTACAFSGPGLADLYVTTSRENLPPDAEPLAGALFRFRPRTPGAPCFPYGG